MSLSEIPTMVNTSRSMAEKALKILEMDAAVGQTFEKTVRYFRTPNQWKPDVERIIADLLNRLHHEDRAEAEAQYESLIRQWVRSIGEHVATKRAMDGLTFVRTGKLRFKLPAHL